MTEVHVYLRVGGTEEQEVGTVSAESGDELIAALPGFLRALADEYEAAATEAGGS